jgi:aromatase
VTPQSHFTEHSVTVSAFPEVVYGVIADVTRWPHFFTPNIHVDVVEQTERQERLRLWAFANEEVRSWTSVRDLDAAARRIRFRQEVSPKPLAFMGGEWSVEPAPEGRTLLRLAHEFAVIDDDPEGVAWINQAINRNDEAELESIKGVAEWGDRRDELVFSFEDSIPIAGDARGVYDFLHQAQSWPDRLPHVARLDLQEPMPNLQVMEMDTKAPDGSIHTTRSVRVCFPSREIFYKQVAPPRLLSAHTGRWLVDETPDGPFVSSRHTVTIRESAIEEVLGPGTGIEEARRYVQRALSGNSRITMDAANAFANVARDR